MESRRRCSLCSGFDVRRVVRASSFEIAECRVCHVAFTLPPPTFVDYAAKDFHAGERREKAGTLTRLQDLHVDWQRLIKMQVEMIAASLPPSATIFEAGCGEGILLEEISKAGYRMASGIEPSASAVIRARAKGLSVEEGYFGASAIPQKADLIVMSHVLEHCEHPAQVLNHVERSLNLGGHLLLTQTHYRGLLPRVYGKDWYAWVPDQHFWHFTPTGLAKLLGQHGFRVETVRFCPLVHASSALTRLAAALPRTQDQFILMAKRGLQQATGSGAARFEAAQ